MIFQGITRIISGAQMGVDLAALDAALALGIDTGGWMTRQFMTEDGSRPDYQEKYGVRDVSSANYPVRTRRNIEDSDATLIVSGFDKLEGGTLLTFAVCRDRHIPMFVLLPATGWNPLVRGELLSFLATHRVSVLNVAGSRESKSPGIYQQTYDRLLAVLTKFQGAYKRGLVK